LEARTTGPQQADRRQGPRRAAAHDHDPHQACPSSAALELRGGCHGAGPRSTHPYHPDILLVIDIGNTNVTLALVSDGAIVTTRRAGTPRSATADELEVLLAGLIGLDGRTFADLSGIAVASVVPALTPPTEGVARAPRITLLSHA